MARTIGFIAAALTALAFVSSAAHSRSAAPDAAASATRDNEVRQTQILKDGVKVLKEKHAAEAIQNYFDKVIASYEAAYPAGTGAVYCARSAPESLLYLAQSANDKKEAVVLGPAWCDAYFLRAYGLIDLGRTAEARASLEKAIAMAPKNAQYLLEFAGLYRGNKDWKEALANFDTAAQLAREFSPPASKMIELGQALRGKGYVLVELGRLDEAQAIYRECLQINPNDKTAMGELAYVQARIKGGKS